MQLQSNKQSWTNIPTATIKPMDKYQGSSTLTPENAVRQANISNHFGPSPLVLDAAYHLVQWYVN